MNETQQVTVQLQESVGHNGTAIAGVQLTVESCDVAFKQLAPPTLTWSLPSPLALDEAWEPVLPPWAVVIISLAVGLLLAGGVCWLLEQRRRQAGRAEDAVVEHAAELCGVITKPPFHVIGRPPVHVIPWGLLKLAAGARTAILAEFG